MLLPMRRCCLIIGVIYLSLICDVNVKAEQDPNWWQHGVFYQIYPRSFKDDDNDGNGDLKGITSKMEHLKDAGITGAWLSPVYTSPQVDAGYDISDFKDIDPMYGTMDDFREMIAKAHELDIKIIMDFVPNHSSDEHPWFEKSVNQEDGYKKFYIWKEGTKDKVPNNWLSVFHGSAWTWNEVRGAWYFHQFSAEQPDLNYRDENLATEMKEVLTFWMDEGVDGFRMDAVPYLFEDEELKDEPPSDDPNAQSGEHESLKHIYTKDQDETYDLIYSWRKFIDDYNADHPDETPRILMSEAYTDLDYTMLYYGDGKDKEGSHIPFNFLMVGQNKDTSAEDIVKSIHEWLTNMPKGRTANWVVGNHDNPRVATRFGPERVDGVNTLIALLPGVMVTYNGEEIGQENGYVPKDQCQDPRGCSASSADYNKTSRDFERTPFHWDDTVNAGFNDGEDPWLPVSENYLKNNLKAQKKVKSNYRAYKELLKLRQNDVFTKGNVSVEVVGTNVILLVRSYEHVNYAALINIGDQDETVDLSEAKPWKGFMLVEHTNGETKKNRDVISINSITLEPYESTVGRVFDQNMEWWKNAVVYQIYPRSFKDSDNDGVGDLRGILSKVDHLKNLGVTAVWLSPIYESPGIDQGYDISDFKKIDPIYGTDADFDALVEALRENGIKLIMDFVPNHSSDQAHWFKESISNSDSPYKDYYVWKKTMDGNEPNNWRSIFKYSAWTFNEVRGEYYLHQFAPQQPDLNYRDENLRNEMKDVLGFWMGRGVDGFRMDAVPYLVEDDKFEDEPRSNNPDATEVEWNYLRHIYTSDCKGTFDVIYDWRKYIDDYTYENKVDAKIMMTEAYTDIYTTMYYYGNKEVDGAHFTFNFQLIEKVNQDSNADDFAEAIQEWLRVKPKHYISNWVLGNHDKHRLATRFGPQNLDGFNMLGAFLPGIMVTYNGEEIGMENGEVTWKEGLDPNACNGLEEDFDRISRDFERTPFHWDNTTNAGFNEGFKPWLPVSEKYKTNNLKSQIGVEKSHYEIYINLVQLRKNHTLALHDDSFHIKAITDKVLVGKRALRLNTTMVHLFNMGDEEQTFNLKVAFDDLTDFLKVVISSGESKREKDMLIDARNVTLDAHESIIATTTSEKISAASALTAVWKILFVSLVSMLINSY